MKEITGNIFDLMFEPEVDSVCITTNGIISSNGKAVMGAGTAGYLAKLYPEVKSILGKSLSKCGNLPFIIGCIKNTEFFAPSKNILDNKLFSCLVWSFPTKNDFKDKSDLELIKKSAIQMVKHADNLNLKNIIIPAPGCGKNTGQLDYTAQVKPVIEDIFDSRFSICFLKE